MYQQMNYDNERPADTLTLDVYPGPGAEFTMFEDEGSGREYREGKFALTRFYAVCDASNRPVEIKVFASKGDYMGKLTSRSYFIQVHITVLGVKIRYCGKAAEYDKRPFAWFYLQDVKNGMILIKTLKMSTDSDLSIRLKY
jgi:hypothetical protein